MISQRVAATETGGPVFVAGVWRSGTSLLYALLNQHPDVALMYESDLPLFWPLFLMPRRNWPERWNFWNSSLDRHRIADQEAELRRITDIRTATEMAYRAYAARNGGTIWGDKSPSYYSYVVRLARLFPAARFIIIWRHPAEICRSILNASTTAPWFRRKGMLLRALLGCEMLRKGVDVLKSRGVAVHELTYGQLVAEPETALCRICGFLDIPYDPKMTSLGDADRSAVYAGQHHDLVRGERIQSSTARPDVLPPRMKSKIDRYLALWAMRYGRNWLLLDDVTAPETGNMSIAERSVDRIRFQCFRLWDSAVLALYCFAPRSLLTGYRNLKTAIGEALARRRDGHHPPPEARIATRGDL